MLSKTEPLKIHDLRALPEWTMHAVRCGKIAQIGTLEEVKSISQPPFQSTTISTGHYGSQRTSTSYMVLGSNNQTQGFSKIVLDRADLIARCKVLFGSLGLDEAEINLMFADLYNDDTGADWFAHSDKRIEDMLRVVEWGIANEPDCEPSEEKSMIWLRWMCRDDFFGKPISEVYAQAQLVVGTDFGVPWFINALDDFKELEKVMEK